MQRRRLIETLSVFENKLSRPERSQVWKSHEILERIIFVYRRAVTLWSVSDLNGVLWAPAGALHIKISNPNDKHHVGLPKCQELGHWCWQHSFRSLRSRPLERSLSSGSEAGPSLVVLIPYLSDAIRRKWMTPTNFPHTTVHGYSWLIRLDWMSSS